MPGSSREVRYDSRRGDHDHLAHLVDAMPIPILVSRTSDGKILLANEHASTLFGIPHDQILGHRTPNFYANRADRARVLAILADNGIVRNFELPGKRADGSQIWVSMSIEPMLVHDEPALFVAFTDLTAHKAMTNALRESEDRFRTIAEQTPIPVMISSLPDGVMLYGNIPLKTIMGIEGEVIGQRVPNFYYDPADRQPFLQHVLAAGSASDYELRLRTPAGTPCWVSVSAQPIVFDNQSALFSSFYDITRHKAAALVLQDYQSHLEREVAERTAALQRATNELRSANTRIAQELRLARDIQLGLLPTSPPWPRSRLDVYAHSLPATEVGGDLYAFFDSPTSAMLGIVIGDISGKGVAAALMMALVSSALDANARAHTRPATLLDTLNLQLTPRLASSRMNAALLVLMIDSDTDTLRLANAGMVAPFCIRQGQAMLLDCGGFPLGAGAMLPYREHTFDLIEGDMLVLVSDGVLEAHNGSGELFGFARLEAWLGGCTGGADCITGALLGAVQDFAAGMPAHDDMTVVVLGPYTSQYPSGQA